MRSIVADVHEHASGIPSALAYAGVEVVERRLTAGDYAIADQAVVERKTVPDLLRSLEAGRFWPQIARIRNEAAWPYLLVEGDLPARARITRTFHGVWLAVSDLGVTVLRSWDQNESTQWLLKLAERRSGYRTRDRPAYAQRPKRLTSAHRQEAALAAASGISTQTARKLLAHFGTVQAVMLASSSELKRVDGVGATRADAIFHLSRDSAKRNPST